jgi:hypothetical protein
MLDWVIIVLLYAFAAGFFRLIGGLGGAADALQQWGSKSASPRGRRSPSSS